MNSDLFSSLLGGKNNGSLGAIGALLPLLLGGGKGVDVSKILGGSGGSVMNLLSGLMGNKDVSGSSSFPPLFGDPNPLSGVLGALGNVSNQASGIKSSSNEGVNNNQKISQYPYELQYNRPDPTIRK